MDDRRELMQDLIATLEALAELSTQLRRATSAMAGAALKLEATMDHAVATAKRLDDAGRLR
jgi:hypothetical protein